MGSVQLTAVVPVSQTDTETTSNGILQPNAGWLLRSTESTRTVTSSFIILFGISGNPEVGLAMLFSGRLYGSEAMPVGSGMLLAIIWHGSP